MKYEEKLRIIVEKLKDERDLTRKGRDTEIMIGTSYFPDLDFDDVGKILLKLMDDEKVLKVKTLRLVLNYDGMPVGDPDDFNYETKYELAYGVLFDEWFAKYAVTGNDPKKDGEPKSTFEYDTSTGILDIGGKQVKFRLHGNPAILLERLTRNKKSSRLSWDELYEMITETEPTKGNNRTAKQKIYNLAEGLSARVAKETGFTEFLKYDFDYVRLNPAYSRLEK